MEAPMTSFLRNSWYVAGWSSELAEDGQLARRMLDEPVLLFRGTDGSVAALADMCPHRFAPLSMGRREGDVVACPYHGLRFDRSGACVLNPHGAGRIPSAARVATYPVVERDLLVWIWMGEPEAADPAAIPDFSFLTSDDYLVSAGDCLTLACHYSLATDNLMDLSHAVFVHEATFGTPDALRGKLTVTQDGSTVSAQIWVADCLPVGGAFPIAGEGRPVDHWMDMIWKPASNMLLKIGATAPGQPREAGIEVLAPHLLTPESATSTHYFFATALPKAGIVRLPPGGKRLPSQKVVFETEDEPILRAVQSRMRGRGLMAMNPVMLPTDAGGMRVRRVLDALIAEEAGGSQAEREALAELMD
jgi:nitrite reductase/ring-hydroxylating ferredoxin subunit